MTVPSVKKRGRPRKKDIEKKKKPGKVGRPPGEAAIMAEYKARLLQSPKSRKVLESILNAALDDDHKHQAAAWKLLVDRLLPLSSFDKEAVKAGRSQIQINITGVENASVSGEEIIDGEYEEIQESVE